MIAKQLASSTRIYGGLSAQQSRLQANGFVLPFGVGYLLTDKGAGKQRNEDVVVVCPQHHLLGVIDGMGGHADGHHAARFCANAITQSDQACLVEKLQQADRHLKQLAQKKMISADAGCCVSLLQALSVNKARKQITLQLACVGDCKILILRPVDNRFGVLYDSDDIPGGLSYLIKQRFNNRIQQQFHTHHYFHSRHQVSHPVCALSHQRPKVLRPPAITLQTGDLVLMMSDGIADNLASDEIIAIITACRKPSAQTYAQSIFITVSHRQRYFIQQNALADLQLANLYGCVKQGRCTGFINATATATGPCWLQPAKLDNNALLCMQVKV
jgi:serine/threonine protein phosphatase PrpC